MNNHSQRLGGYCVTLNEEARIGLLLKHAMQWSDEFTVFDKHSLDKTRRIAESHGARVINITKSEQGHERHGDLIRSCESDWIMLCTPSSIPTKPLINKIRSIIDDEANRDVDGILVPRKTWSFGHHNPTGPWGICYIPCVVKRTSPYLSNTIHECLKEGAKLKRIQYSHDTHVAHLTHPDSFSFLTSHLSYAKQVAIDDPKNALETSRRTLRKLRNRIALRIRSPLQYHAWHAYHHSICLACLDIIHGRDIREEYTGRASDYIRDYWSELDSVP